MFPYANLCLTSRFCIKVGDQIELGITRSNGAFTQVLISSVLPYCAAVEIRVVAHHVHLNY
jgi:hypothetical protein